MHYFASWMLMLGMAPWLVGCGGLVEVEVKEDAVSLLNESSTIALSLPFSGTTIPFSYISGLAEGLSASDLTMSGEEFAKLSASTPLFAEIRIGTWQTEGYALRVSTALSLTSVSCPQDGYEPDVPTLGEAQALGQAFAVCTKVSSEGTTLYPQTPLFLVERSESTSQTSAPSQTGGQASSSPEPTNLVFVTTPENFVVGSDVALGEVVLHLTDAAGAIVTTGDRDIGLALKANPGDASLGGVTTVRSQQGVAKFSELTITQTAAGSGYTLEASAGSLTRSSKPFAALAGDGVEVAVSQTGGEDVISAVDQFGNALFTFQTVGMNDLAGRGTQSEPLSFVVAEDTQGTITVSLPGEETASLVCNALPGFVSLDAPRTTLTFSPLHAHIAQDITFDCVVRDADSQSLLSLYMEFDVSAVNDAPVLSLKGNNNVRGFSGAGSAASPYTFVIDQDSSDGEVLFGASDEEGASTTIVCTGPAFLNIDQGQEKFTMNPSGAQVGASQAISCHASDGNSSSAPIALEVSVNAHIPDGGSGSGSLRDMILTANANAGDDVISLGAGTYLLTITGTGEDLNATGDLDITDTAGSLTIRGAGTAHTVIDASALSDRVMHVIASAHVILEDLTVRNGNVQDGQAGGGLRNHGTMTLTRVHVLGNTVQRQQWGRHRQLQRSHPQPYQRLRGKQPSDQLQRDSQHRRRHLRLRQPQHGRLGGGLQQCHALGRRDRRLWKQQRDHSLGDSWQHCDCGGRVFHPLRQPHCHRLAYPRQYGRRQHWRRLQYQQWRGRHPGAWHL